MTLSNETSASQMPKPVKWHKSRTFTWMAVVASILAVVVFGFLLFNLNVLETKYGEIRDEKERIELAIADRKKDRRNLLAEIESLKIEKSTLEDDLAQGRVLQQKLTILIEGVDTAQRQLTSMANEVIAAERLRDQRDGFEAAKTSLLEEISELDGKKEDLTAAIASLKRRKSTASADTTTAEIARNRLKAEVEDLQDRKQEKDIVQSQLTEAQVALGASQVKKKQVEDQLLGITTEIAGAEAKLESIIQVRDKAHIEQTSLESQVATTRTEMEDEWSELAGVKAEIASLRSQRSELETELQDATKKRDALDADALGKEKIRDELAEQLKTISANLAAKSSLFDQKLAELEGERSELAKVEVDIASLRSQRSELETELQDATKKRDALDADALGKEKIRDELAEQLKTISANLAAEKSLYDQKESERIVAETRLADLKAKLKNHDGLEAQIAQLQPVLEELEKAVKNAKDSLSSRLGKSEAALSRLHDLLQQADGVENELDAFSSSRSSLRKALDALRAEEVALIARIADLKRLANNPEPIFPTSTEPEPVDLPTEDTNTPPQGDN